MESKMLGDFAWLKGLALSNKCSAVEVLCEDNRVSRFPAHAVILCVQSEVFRAMLESDNFSEGQTGKITIHGHEPRVIEYFLRFFYFNSLPEVMHTSYLIKLLELAHLYEVHDLVSECSRKLERCLTEETLCEIYELASLRSLKTLQEKCLIKIRKNLMIIFQNDLHFHLNTVCVHAMYAELEDNEQEAVSNARLRMLKWRSFAYTVTAEEKDLLHKCTKSPYARQAQEIDWADDLCMSSQQSDVDIVPEYDEKATFPAHSLILNQQSEVFEKLWSIARPEGETRLRIYMKDVNSRILEYFLRFLYTRFFPEAISETNLISLLNVAHVYKIHSLKLKCETRLAELLSPANSCMFLALSRRIGAKKLEADCLYEIQQNLDVVLFNNLHFDLDQEDMIQILAAKRWTSEILDEKRKYHINEWAKWHCCKEGIDPSQVPHLVAPIVSAVVFQPFTIRMLSDISLEDREKIRPKYRTRARQYVL